GLLGRRDVAGPAQAIAARHPSLAGDAQPTVWRAVVHSSADAALVEDSAKVPGWRDIGLSGHGAAAVTWNRRAHSPAGLVVRRGPGGVQAGDSRAPHHGVEQAERPGPDVMATSVEGG